LTNHKDIINYAWVRRFTEIKLRPENWIYHFYTYVDDNIYVLENYEEIKNPNLADDYYFYLMNSIFVKMPLFIINILLIVLAIYEFNFGEKEFT